MSRNILVLSILTLAACNTNTGAEAVYDGDPMGRIAGTVVDVDGNALAGVTVTVDGLSAVTDGAGYYTVDAVPPGQSLVVEFTHPGFAKGYKKAQLISWETVPVDATLSEIDGYDIFDSAIGGVVEVGDVWVEFGPDAIRYADGRDFDGLVRVEVTYVDPYTEDIKFAPGDLTALAYNRSNPEAKEATEPAQLVSYGMVDVTLLDEETGEPLQLEDGQSATVSMPITNGDLPSVYHMLEGDEQQTWSFDTKKGIWVEEGMGSVVPVMEDIIDDDPESETYGEVIGQRATGGLAFEFEASHFSWYNCDQGFVPSCAVGQVKDVLGFPIRGARVDATGRQSSWSGYTDEDGWFVATVMVGDTVNFKATTHVGGKNYTKDRGSVYLYGYGSSSRDCQPIDNMDIDVCREAGIVMADNLQLHVSGMDAGTGADQLRAWFWEPPGEPWRCDNPWEEIPIDTCVVSDPTNYPEQFRPRSVGIDHETRSAGSWLELRTPRDTYGLVEDEVNGNPVYIYETVTLGEPGTMDVTDHNIDLRAGDTVYARAPGSSDAYFGPIQNERWMTIPNDLTLTNMNGAQGSVARSGGIDLRFQGQGNDDHVFVFVTGDAEQEGLMCRYRDDGNVTISASDLGNLNPDWVSVSVYRPEIGWTMGPDGLPIRIQGLSGSIVEAQLR